MAGGLGILRRFVFQPATAKSLALFRIVSGLIVLGSLGQHNPVEFSRLPRVLRSMPTGANFIYGLIDPTPSVVRTATVATAISALCLTVGLFSRSSALVTAALATYVLGVPQLFGKVAHYHHVVWFAGVLVLAPAGAAWSVDAWRRRADPMPPVSPRYGFALGVAGLAIGQIYLFPGLAKFRSAGLEWAFSDNLRNITYAKASQVEGWHAILDVTRWPVVFQLGALALMVLEVAFIFLLLSRRLAPIAIFGGLAFHAMTYLTLRISFWSLVLSYVVFLNWLQRRNAPPNDLGDGVGPQRWAIAAGTAFLVLVAASGIGIVAPRVRPYPDAWPIAMYPSFAGIARDTTTRVEVDAVVAGEVRRDLDRKVAFGGWMNTDRYVGLLNSLDRSPSETRIRLAAFARASDRHGNLEPGTTELRFFRRTIDVTPARRGRIVKEESIGVASL